MNKDVQKLVHEAIILIDNCWAHHGDGSDLIVDEHKLFHIMHNQVLKRLRIANQVLNVQIPDIRKNEYNCTDCGLLKELGSRCKHCDDIEIGLIQQGIIK